MKIKTTIAALSLLITGASFSHAAVLSISNLDSFTNDTLYADKNNVRMNGGLVTIGYFNSASINPTTIAGATGLYANLGNFIVVSTAVPGSPLSSAEFTPSIAGYADNASLAPGAIGGLVPASIGQLNAGNTLIGRNYYSIITSAASLAAAALAPVADTQFALVLLGQLPDESSGEIGLTSNPVSGPVGTIGTLGTLNGDIGFGEGAYITLKMSQVPEPSAALLGAIGALGLLRRRRI